MSANCCSRFGLTRFRIDVGELLLLGRLVPPTHTLLTIAFISFPLDACEIGLHAAVENTWLEEELFQAVCTPEGAVIQEYTDRLRTVSGQID